ncbi:Rho termination factor, N-terminal domain [Micromonospora viridifaciens]|uniref:Rho termination factor, N-terminal domain n=1 Tax=Micromonospora viridifaciens TaxID=1881 RepID=A0A1C4ZMN2_MICVI|nr:Rho termination factor N-terminal domain-containing protein [Micromonospora viridifaciens]SCF34139.1 Rho termination factor, N-terminal domain [Micromonospora viridifaciens]
MTDARFSRAVLARVAEFLQQLSEADIADLAEGRARLAVVPASPQVPAARPAPAAAPGSRAGRAAVEPASRLAAGPAPRPAAPAVELDVARTTLTAMTSRGDGAAYLAPWAVKDLRALAAQLGLRGVTGLKKIDLIDRIVDRTIGYRLNSSAIRQR